MGIKYKCPCCGYYTFEEKPAGHYDIWDVSNRPYKITKKYLKSLNFQV